MKKIIIVLLLVVIFLTGCEEKTKKDYREYSFTGVSWTREEVNGTETIRFNIDGSFSYTCDCGNPVNDADLCDSYTYNNDTKEIKLSCIEITEDTITSIKIVNSTEDSLELDFDGEIRKFKKASE